MLIRYMIKKTLLFLLALLMFLAGVVLFNTLTFRSKQLSVKTEPAPEIPASAIEHFKKAITFKTISHADPSKFDSSAFIGYRSFLETTYPLTHQQLQKEIVVKYSLLYKWTGIDSAAKPIVLMAHQDVVPIEDGTQSIWTVDPFEGVVKEDFIWGRGSTDDKINMISILEAVEKLLAKGFKPQRSVYLAFGHDEEIGGNGAKAIAALLKERGVEAEMVLDEGGIITREKVPGMKIPVALIGTSEKGFLSVELSVEKNGGHSSMPEKETSLDILMKALIRLRENPFKSDFSPSTRDFIEILGPEMPFTQKMAFANLWLFRPVVNNIYESSPGGNAMIRTTLVPTILKAGVKDNVVPTVASATVNIRLLPGDSSAEVMSRLKEIIADERVKLTIHSAFLAEPSSVTSSESFAYKKVDKMIRKTFDGLVATPFLMIGGTDSRHFGEVSKGIVKFSPMVDPIGFHGIDERVSLESFRTSLWFFEQLLQDLN
jgi:carboxypeptidase PM20D1